MAHTELNLRERRVIEDMLTAKISVREIAAEIGRHVSTVYRDIKRNGYTDTELPELNGYYGVVAQRSATQRRARRRKLVRLVGLRKAVIKQLKEGWSPEQIAGRLQFEGQTVRVSHETIYAYVYGPDGQSRQLARYLPNSYGVDVAFDIIPNDWNNTFMVAVLPKWAQEGGMTAVLKRLGDPEARERIKANPRPMWLIVKAEKWSDIVVLNATENKHLIGADFAEIGRMRNCHPYDAVLDTLLEEGENMMSALWASKSFRNNDIDLCLSQPECAVISDTIALANEGVLSDKVGSLSGYGWAARFLQNYVRDRNVLPLTEAIRRITSVPAERLNIKDRGTLAKGKKADICVFDPATIESNCNAKDLRRYASGIAHVIVNGELAMYNGKRTDVNNGTVLRG